VTAGRFAPTPSGLLHLGSLFTALLAWLQVRALGGRFIVRVEDLDRARAVPVVDAQLASLRRLGIDWEEGPDVGGMHAPYVQSQRGASYERAMETLSSRNLIYPCYCSRADILRAAEAPHGMGEEGPRYPGTCRDLSSAERERRRQAGRQAAWRFRAPREPVGFDDLVCGAVSQDVQAAVGDFVLRRADGVIAYQLAVVVDDVEMAVTHVLRGRDLLASTPRQILLYRALGATPPRFAHVPLLVGTDGEKLSKRNGGELSQDFDPGRVLALLARLSGLAGEAPHTPHELISRFDTARLARLPPTLTVDQGQLSS
jgi:glutamyl-tRNA synthetase